MPKNKIANSAYQRLSNNTRVTAEHINAVEEIAYGAINEINNLLFNLGLTGEIDNSITWDEIDGKPDLSAAGHTHQDILDSISNIMSILQADTEALDTLQEIIDFIKSDETDLLNHTADRGIHKRVTLSLTKPENMVAGDIWLKDLSDPTKQYAFIKLSNLVGTITVPTYTLPSLGLVENVVSLDIPEWIESANENIVLSNLVGTITVPTYTLPNLGLADSITQQQFI